MPYFARTRRLLVEVPARVKLLGSSSERAAGSVLCMSACTTHAQPASHSPIKEEPATPGQETGDSLLEYLIVRLPTSYNQRHLGTIERI